jgi:Tol biopolymer transport system component
MSLSNIGRIVIAIVAVVLCASSGNKQQAGTTTGYGSTQKNVVYYEPRPRFDWPHTRGATYRVVLWRVPIRGGQRVALYDQVNYTEKQWVPPDDLDFETRYELYIYNDAQQVISSWGFTLGYQPPQVISPAPNGKVKNLSPDIRIAPFAYPYVWYSFEIADNRTFDKPIDQGYIPHQDNVRQFAGRDNELNTADDIRYVEWSTNRVLKPNKTYYYRVRGFYFPKSDVPAGTTPDRAQAIGHSEATGEFSIPPQSGSDSLANVTQVTRDNTRTWMPSISKRLNIAYVMELQDGGGEIRVAGATSRAGVPVFDTGREEYTKSVKGSYDSHPQWDVDGEGLFFDSNRSQKVFNIWFKRRDSRGYTQLTFHNVNAEFPTLSKDGGRVAYQVANAENAAGYSIWVVDRDGRSATELGSGQFPQFSPDGTKIAFSQRDSLGFSQVWYMDANGGNRVQLTNEYNNLYPTWSPNSKRLAFISDRAGNDDIWMIELDGARMVQLTNYLGRDTTPEFTPDGRYILFSSTRNGEISHIWMGEVTAQ